MAHAIYTDVHVPFAITAGLRRRGIDVLTSQEDETQRLNDEEMLVRCMVLQRILFTQDDDFLEITSNWQQQHREFMAIAYCHQLATGIGEVIEDLELIATCASVEEVRNCVFFLPLQ